MQAGDHCKSSSSSFQVAGWVVQGLLGQRSPTFLAPETNFVEDNFSTDCGAGDGSGGNASNGERRGAADEASLAHLPLTSCFPPVPVRSPGSWGPLC